MVNQNKDLINIQFVKKQSFQKPCLDNQAIFPRFAINSLLVLELGDVSGAGSGVIAGVFFWIGAGDCAGDGAGDGAGLQT